jgi:hypothetical protein
VTKLALAATTILLCMSAPLLAEEALVTRVIVVHSDNSGAYPKEILETGVIMS